MKRPASRKMESWVETTCVTSASRFDFQRGLIRLEPLNKNAKGSEGLRPEEHLEMNEQIDQ